MSKSVIVAAAMTLFGCAEYANACSRCGFLGRNCRLQSVSHVAKVVHAAPVYVAPVVQPASVLVVNNQYAAPIAQSGSTVFGYQAASQQYFINPIEYQRQSAEFVKAALTTSQLAVSGYNQTTQTQLALQAPVLELMARGQSASQVLNAAGFTQPLQQQSTILRITNGKVETLDPEQFNAQYGQNLGQPGQATNPDDRVPPAPTPERGNSILGQRCAKCHGLQLAEPKGGLFLDAENRLNCNQFARAVRAIKSGTMPPKSEPPLTQNEKGLLFDELDSLTDLAQ
jgi:mono/diheme cytochrome c family protein